MATGLKSGSSKILFVRPRDDPFVCAIDFMLVFDTDLFRHYDNAAQVTVADQGMVKTPSSATVN
jgi:hypothetical protein